MAPTRAPQTPGLPSSWTRYLSLCVIVLFLGGPAGLCACNALDNDSDPLPEKRDGEISARAFVFAQVTDPGGGAGGWWAGCLHLHLQRAPEKDRDSLVTCNIEFGIPIVTEEGGRIPVRRAQQIAADVTNHAVATVPRDGRMSSEICGDVKKSIERAAGKARKGSRVIGRCGQTFGQVPEIDWP